MKLYYKPGACSLATHIILEWIGEPYQTQNVADILKSPDYLKINPAGAVPALDVDGWTLTQNVAILNFIADSYPAAQLGGDGTIKGRAEVNRWLGFLNSDVHPSFKPLFGATAYLQDKSTIAQTREHARTSLRALFERIDTQLNGRDWLTGERSIADPYLFVVSRWARAMRVDLSGLVDLEGFHRRMLEDAAVQRALASEGIDPAT